MNVMCPKCTSIDARSLSFIHRESLHTLLAKEAAPPSRKSVAGWWLLAAVCGLLLLVSIRDFGLASIAFAAGTSLSAWMVKQNRAYNSARFPELYNRWQQSFMCSRCGAVFISS